MIRRLRSLLAAAVSAALVVMSPGLEPARLFAQAAGRAVPVEGLRILPGMRAAAPGAVLTGLSLPAALTPVLPTPSLLPAVSAVPPAAALAATTQALAPQFELLGKAETGADASRGAGQEIIDLLTRTRSARVSATVDVSGALATAAGAIPARLAASAPSEAAKSAAPAAPAPAPVKKIDSALSYNLHRLLLKTVAAITGALYSLPSAGPSITRSLVSQAADKSVVFSDYDDTLAGYNQVLPPEMVAAVQAVQAAGKDFVMISDRGDAPRRDQLTVFESMASLPAENRAGMYVAANSGGRVYRYDEKGEPVLMFEAAPLEGAQKERVSQAVEATKARLKEVGAEQHVPRDGKDSPAEIWQTYSYAMMLKPGTTPGQLYGAAALFEEELRKRGIGIEVSPRFAKNQANPPYLNFSIVTKETSAGFIAKALGVKVRDVVIIGDSMYAPRRAKKDSWLTRLAAYLSGGDLSKTGNATDRNMEKALPGALTLGVGTTGDPRTSNLWVLEGKGPALTRQVLMSMASRPGRSAQSRSADWRRKLVLANASAAAAAVILIAIAAVGYYAMFQAGADMTRQFEQMLRERVRDSDGILPAWGMLTVSSKGALKRGLTAAAPFLKWLGLASLTAAIYAGYYYAMTHNAPVHHGFELPPGYRGPVPSDADIVRLSGGFLGFAGIVGLVKGHGAAPTVTEAQIRDAAASAAAFKGKPWSQTEYNMSYSNILADLKARGATEAQIELYKKLCDEAPIIGGRFNPWSGD